MWLTRVALLLQAAVVLFAVLRLSWIWIIFAVGTAMNLAVQPDMHRRQIFGQRGDRP